MPRECLLNGGCVLWNIWNIWASRSGERGLPLGKTWAAFVWLCVWRGGSPSWLPVCLGTLFLLACVFLSGSAVSFPFSVLIVNLVLNVLSSSTFLLAQPPLGCVTAGGRPLLLSWLSPRRCLSSPWPALPRPAFLACYCASFTTLPPFSGAV